MRTKKIYLTPSVRTVELLESAHLMSVSTDSTVGAGSTTTEGGSSDDEAKIHDSSDLWNTEW